MVSRNISLSSDTCQGGLQNCFSLHFFFGWTLDSLIPVDLKAFYNTVQWFPNFLHFCFQIFPRFLCFFAVFLPTRWCPCCSSWWKMQRPWKPRPCALRTVPRQWGDGEELTIGGSNWELRTFTHDVYIHEWLWMRIIDSSNNDTDKNHV